MLTGSSTQLANGAATASGLPALRMRGVDFSYCSAPDNAKPLYTGFELSIEQGSVLAVMGASGCGKSTLGKMMARIISPTAGQIEWSPEFRKRADVVYMDQHPMNSIFPWQTVRRNLQYPLEKLGWPGLEATARVAYLAALFRLEAVLDALPAQVSGGELQRVALARCLSWRPGLVILDEPFSALDRDVKTNIILALHELATKDGMTVVLITHNVSDALAIGVRYLVIGDRPVRIMSDLEFKSPHPRERGSLDYDRMETALVTCIREGLV
jgi:NitT/TauT family transport system ATP-binding protein